MSTFFCIIKVEEQSLFRAGNRQRNIRKISGAAFDVKLLRPTFCKESTSQHEHIKIQEGECYRSCTQ